MNFCLTLIKVDVWSRRTIHELTASLDNSTSLEKRISTLDDTLTENWSRLSTLKVRAEPDLNTTVTSDLGDVRANLDEIDKTLKRVEEARQNAIERVDKFNAEKDKLMKYVDELSLWLKTKDKSLKSIEKTNRGENIKKCKDLNVELVEQRENIENTKDHLNNLIRTFHSSDKIDDLVQEGVSFTEAKLFFRFF